MPRRSFIHLPRLVSLGLWFCTIGLLIPSRSWANPVDILGLSSRTAARGDTATASCEGAGCLFYNPGRLSLLKGFSLFGGVQGQTASFSLPGGDASVHDPLYAHVGLDVTIPFKGFLKDKVRVGVMLSAPVNEIAYIKMHLPSDPFYPYFENRTQRLILIPGVSFKLLDSVTWGRIGLGFGVNYFAGLDGAIIGYEGATRSVEARVWEELEGRFGTNLGLSWELGRFKMGISYRQAFGVDFHNISFNRVAGTNLNIDLTAKSLYSPHTVSYGVHYGGEGFTLDLDVSEYLWSYYRTPFVDMRSQLPLVGDLASALPEVRFKNTLGVKLGGTYALMKGVTLSGGLSFEQAMISGQTGVTNLLDGHKLGISTGLSYALTSKITVHAHVRYLTLLGETHTKRTLRTDADCGSSIPLAGGAALADEVPCVPDDATTQGFQTSNPGYPSITSSGYMLSGGLTLEVRQ